ncbi:MAG: phosphoribosylanthranilate isomerase [Cellvibrionales bacterium]|nr:phosphoribosylanthranilate isomerase [Cellvibrionales bacterium]
MISSSSASSQPSSRTRVKICGITREQDALAAAYAGADALGFVFYPPSPRAVTAERAAELCRPLPPFVERVGLFVNASAADVQAVLDIVPLTLIQFHGNESPAFCEQFATPYMKALRIGADDSGETLAQIKAHTAAQGFLLDAYEKGVPGGTGKTFDWSRIPSGIDQPVILAGGLDADNVTHAIAEVAPYAVDVSSGIEQAPGIKDVEKINRFMQAVALAGH